MRTLLLIALLAGPTAAQSHDQLQVARWRAAYVLPHRVKAVSMVADRIVSFRSRYKAVGSVTGVPWGVLASLHNMEASGSFSKHLHEGSSLQWRTRWIPKGRPKTGNPPFTWEYSAIDAMQYDNMGARDWARLGPLLTAVENYNGSGYRRFHPTTPSPYLWSFSSVERPGKYVADGKWSSTARSGQVGVVPILKELERRGEINLPVD